MRRSAKKSLSAYGWIAALYFRTSCIELACDRIEAVHFVVSSPIVAIESNQGGSGDTAGEACRRSGTPEETGALDASLSTVCVGTGATRRTESRKYR